MIRNSPYTSKEKKALIGLVATPIGNIDDITLRAIKFLKEADIIACEDTRNTGLLLSRLGIKPKKLVSLYAQTEAKQAKVLVQEIKEKKLTLAYCSDAGMPGISDPGALLVKEAYEEGVNVTVLPGPTASLSALVLSGIDSADFSFYGFLPTKETAEKTFLTNLKDREETLIFYESPKRIKKTLKIMEDVFGETREVSLIRELTKIHEEVVHGTLKELNEVPIEEKGECVIVVKGAEAKAELTDEEIASLLKKGLKEGKSLSDLSKEISQNYPASKKRVYNLGLQLKKN